MMGIEYFLLCMMYMMYRIYKIITYFKLYKIIDLMIHIVNIQSINFFNDTSLLNRHSLDIVNKMNNWFDQISHTNN